jgi:ribosomal protein L7Ae-like RNA K-turn-binding protein
MENIDISFVTTATNKHVGLTINLIESYKKMKHVDKSEMIIIFKDITEINRKKIEDFIENYNIKIINAPDKSRCYRKDLGWKSAKSNMIAFVDVDCTFTSNYLEILLQNLNHPIIRGKNIYDSNERKISKLNACYRTLCDDMFFENETFTPNLILSRDVLEKINGFDEDNNIDQQDDYILSMRLKEKMDVKIHHIDACLINQYEFNLKKLKRTWKGYGLGYGYRFWLKNAPKKGLKTFIEFTPPLVYIKEKPIDYFFFSLYQWSMTFLGYIEGLIKYRHKNKEKISD